MSDVSDYRLESVSMTPDPVDAGRSVVASVGLTIVTARDVSATASGWTGSGPWVQTIAVTTGASGAVYTDHTATVEQRRQEADAALTASVVSGGIRLTAYGRKPTSSIPMRVTDGPMRTVAVTASSWSGSGPWTATVALPRGAHTAMAGPVSGSSDQATVIACGIHVSAVSGSTVTLRALWAKPPSVRVGIAYL